MRSIRRTLPSGRVAASVGFTAIRSGNGWALPLAIDQGAVLGQQPDALLSQCAQGQGALAAARGQHHRHGALAAAEREGVQPGQATRLEVLADAREEEVVDGLVHEMLVLALDHERPVARSRIETARPK